MVSKITLIEPHLDNAQFGPGGSEPKSTTSPAKQPKSRTKMLLQGMVGFVVMAAILWVVFSRVGSNGTEE